MRVRYCAGSRIVPKEKTPGYAGRYSLFTLSGRGGSTRRLHEVSSAAIRKASEFLILLPLRTAKGAGKAFSRAFVLGGEFR